MKVFISPEIYERLKQYSDVVGSSPVQAANEALADWLDTIGTARVESVIEKMSNVRPN